MLEYKYQRFLCSVKTCTDMTNSICFICVVSSIALSLIMYQKLAKGYIVVYSEN